MQSNGKNSITIGIVAHNNAADIIYTLRSILKQRGSSFTIDEIVVISDGSSDKTTEKVAKYAEKYPIIKLFEGAKHRGKVVRLHQLFSLVKSKYIYIFDGNVILFKNNVLETMSRAFNTQNTALVSPNLEPMHVKGFKPNLIKSWNNLITKPKKYFNSGNTIFNFRGEAFAIKTSTAHNIVFPKIVISESPYLFFTVKAQNLNFKFVSLATILFRTPLTFKEYVEQKQMLISEKNNLISIFGKEVNKEYHLPFTLRLRGLVFSTLKNPLNIGLIPLFAIIDLFAAYSSFRKKDRVWTTFPTRKSKAHSY